MSRCLSVLVLAVVLGCALDVTAEESRVSAEQAETERLVDELRAVASELRGLEWKRPVPVELLTRAQSRQMLLDAINAELPPEELDAMNRMSRRLQMIGPDENLLTIYVDMLAAGGGGFYDPAKKTLYVIAGQPPASQKPVMIHELIHALEDQHLDFHAKQKALEKDPDRLFAWRCLMEGAAEVARYAFEARFPEATKAYLEGHAQNVELRQGAGRLAKVPAFLKLPTLLHYRIGPKLVSDALAADPGDATFGAFPTRMDALYADPPVSQEQCLHPAKFLGARRDQPQTIVWGGDLAAAAGEGWSELDQFTSGELDFALWLDRHLSEDDGELTAIESVRGTYVVDDAWRAAVGWDAGRHVFLEHAEKELAFVSAYAFDSAADAREAFDAVHRVLRKTHGAGYVELDRRRATPGNDGDRVDYACPVGRSRMLRRGAELLILDGLPEDRFEALWPVVEQTTFVRDPRDTWRPEDDPLAGFDFVDRRRGIGLKLPNRAWVRDAKPDPRLTRDPTYVTTLRRDGVELHIQAIDYGTRTADLPRFIRDTLGAYASLATPDRLTQATVMGESGLSVRLSEPGSGGVRELYVGSDGHRTVSVTLRGGERRVRSWQAEIDAIIAGIGSVLSY